MRVPAWIRVLGAVECISAVWAFYGPASVLRFHGISSIPIGCALLVVAVVASVSAIGGYLLMRGDLRGVRPSAYALFAQSLRISMPGLVWLAGLGWTVNLVLYEGRGLVPDGQDIAAWVGHNPYAGFFAINVPALLFLALLLGWHRIRFAEVTEQHRASAV